MNLKFTKPAIQPQQDTPFATRIHNGRPRPRRFEGRRGSNGLRAAPQQEIEDRAAHFTRLLLPGRSAAGGANEAPAMDRQNARSNAELEHQEALTGETNAGVPRPLGLSAVGRSSAPTSKALPQLWPAEWWLRRAAFRFARKFRTGRARPIPRAASPKSAAAEWRGRIRSEEHTSELQSPV